MVALSNLKTFLDAIGRNPKLELEWVDLLSQLEFVGCRKILKNVPFSNMNVSVLKHLAEEASHAYLMKHAAEESGLPVRPWSEGLFAKAGYEYFQTLDTEVSRMQYREEDRYPAVSWAIETRVLTLYPSYSEVCAFPKVKRILSQVMAQEEKHALQFSEFSFSDTEKGNILRVEERLWNRFIERAMSVIQSL